MRWKFKKKSNSRARVRATTIPHLVLVENVVAYARGKMLV